MTSDRPYTDADLRAEAASCLASLSALPTPHDVKHHLPQTYIDSHRTDDGGATWGDLLDADGLDAAAACINALIDGAADVSEWAINLGADNLQPSTDQITVTGDNRPIARIHFAFDPGMPADARADFITGIGEAIADLL